MYSATEGKFFKGANFSEKFIPGHWLLEGFVGDALLLVTTMLCVCHTTPTQNGSVYILYSGWPTTTVDCLALTVRLQFEAKVYKNFTVLTLK